jgi:predicted DNA-binding antitoxin AbrB/MazE fold protein
MSKTLRAVIREGKIEPLEEVDLPEGSKVLVTLLPDEEAEFWLGVGQASLDAIWANPEDDVYAQLLKE